MRPRIHPGLLALLAAVVLAAAFTITGHGPLAGDDAPVATTPAGAVEPKPAPAAQASVADPADTSPGMIPIDTDGAPLANAITVPDLPAFERANVRLFDVQRSLDTPVTPLARAADTACRRLDESVPLLAALRATCADTIAYAKLGRVLLKRCDAANAACARTAERTADAAAGIVRTRRAYARAIRATLPASDCRRTLLPTGAVLAATSTLAQAYRDLAGAARRADSAALQYAITGLEQADREAHAAGDGLPAQVAIDQLRLACHLTRYPDPVTG